MDEMVAEVNRTQVAPEEVLSDRAYYYDRRIDVLQPGSARREEGCI